MKKKSLILGGIIGALVIGNVYFYGLSEQRGKEKSELFISYEKNFKGWDECSKEYSDCAKDFNENERIIEEIVDKTIEFLNKRSSGHVSIEEIMKYSTDTVDILTNNKRIENVTNE